MFGLSLIERYLFSLPEYRLELQRRNFIEIYSYNGLLPTRKVIEFDGDTVLCRVCGDRASGFHYGVHACEGCKGFFRRSIQQKIQYRPCIKSQQCGITRVNRNRCQYCRLKKCIAVGMSRDAVRFGRVPKKEKAKIIEQMQRVNCHTQATLLTSVLDSPGDMVQRIIQAHHKTCEFTRAKFCMLHERAWQTPSFVNCPAHMACPLNPSPGSGDGVQKWEEYADCFTPVIRDVVNFAKSIPGFQVFSREDQVTLLKAGTFEVLLIHLACLFDSSNNTMMFTNGQLYRRIALTVTNCAGFLLDSMFDFSERFNELRLTDEEIALFSALVIIASDRPGLRNVEQIEIVQNKITQSLQALMKIRHPDDGAIFPKLLTKIPDLRTLNALHSEKLLGLSLPQNGNGPKFAGKTEKSKLLERETSAILESDFLSSAHPAMKHLSMANHDHVRMEKLDGAPIIAHQVAMEAQRKEVVLQTPFGTFHRYPPEIKSLPAFKVEQVDDEAPSIGNTVNDRPADGEGKLNITLPPTESSPLTRSPNCHEKSRDSVISQSYSSSLCSTPEPLDLDLPADQHRMSQLSPVMFSYPGGKSPSPKQELTRATSEGPQLDHNRKRTLDKRTGEYKIPRLWDYEMRSSRSNSLSSNCSTESIDSAYRTISNPSTPRTHIHESRSPYLVSELLGRSTTSVTVSNAIATAKDSPGSRDSARTETTQAKVSAGMNPSLSCPALKSVLATPPIVAPPPWLVLEKNSVSAKMSSEIPGAEDVESDPSQVHKKLRMKGQITSRSNTPENRVPESTSVTSPNPHTSLPYGFPISRAQSDGQKDSKTSDFPFITDLVCGSDGSEPTSRFVDDSNVSPIVIKSGPEDSLPGRPVSEQNGRIIPCSPFEQQPEISLSGVDSQNDQRESTKLYGMTKSEKPEPDVTKGSKHVADESSKLAGDTATSRNCTLFPGAMPYFSGAISPFNAYLSVGYPNGGVLNPYQHYTALQHYHRTLQQLQVQTHAHLQAQWKRHQQQVALESQAAHQKDTATSISLRAARHPLNLTGKSSPNPAPEALSELH